MKIQFNIPQKIKKGWGYELIIENNDKYCGKILHYDKKGSISSGHFHSLKFETFYVVKGTFSFFYWDEDGNKTQKIIMTGETISIPNCCPHQLVCLEDDSEIFEVSTPHSDEDVTRILPGDSQK